MNKKLLLLVIMLTTTSCNAQLGKNMFEISTEYTSKNYNSRIRQIIIHDTEGGFEGSLATLDGDTERQVSSHYLVNDVPTTKNPHYIYRLVPDKDRSWHAGVSEWRGDVDLNNSSIGVEIVNKDGNKTPYPPKQIEAVIFLVKQLIATYDVLPTNIVGHSDIAPDRKSDPGIDFPWKKLFDNGIGCWYDDEDIKSYTQKINTLPATATIKSYLQHYGYKINTSNPNKDEQYVDVVKAFQRHFSPDKVDGIMSLKNYIILRSLVKKYNHVD